MVALKEAAKARYVSQMFARISRRYDLLNAVMSWGQDQGWRRLAVKMAAPSGEGLGLDVAAGTADLTLELAKASRAVVALDLCKEMMVGGRIKLAQLGMSERVTFIEGNALEMPFPDDVFECVTVAFGVRNMDSPYHAFCEMRRVAVPAGRVVCLEILRPDDGILGRLYNLYLNMAIPRLGRWLAGDLEAYRYLSESVVHFKGPESLKKDMEMAGLRDVRYRTLNCGTVSIHVGIK
ncbi:MAG: ubiquinone/menaquinone biosynthesis methyltransferase [Dehalococcoidia bacterium]|nr:ubiquinone/menaquinone biosynthesis methyltransferase [Dehalococcoidia bacterium]